MAVAARDNNDCIKNTCAPRGSWRPLVLLASASHRRGSGASLTSSSASEEARASFSACVLEALCRRPWYPAAASGHAVTMVKAHSASDWPKARSVAEQPKDVLGELVTARRTLNMTDRQEKLARSVSKSEYKRLERCCRRESRDDWEEVSKLIASVADNLADMPVSDAWAGKTLQARRRAARAPQLLPTMKLRVAVGACTRCSSSGSGAPFPSFARSVARARAAGRSEVRCAVKICRQLPRERQGGAVVMAKTSEKRLAARRARYAAQRRARPREGTAMPGRSEQVILQRLRDAWATGKWQSTYDQRAKQVEALCDMRASAGRQRVERRKQGMTARTRKYAQPADIAAEQRAQRQNDLRTGKILGRRLRGAGEHRRDAASCSAARAGTRDVRRLPAALNRHVGSLRSATAAWPG